MISNSINLEKQFETYNGIVIRLRYYIKVVINRNYNCITKEEEFIVSNLGTEPDTNRPIKMEVGIEECLHIEFEFNQSKFHLKDCILGKVFFNLVRIKIKHMELSIIRKEIVGTGQNAVTETENLNKFEIMDGAPVKGECIPIRFYLASTDLTPTYPNVNIRREPWQFLQIFVSNYLKRDKNFWLGEGRGEGGPRLLHF